MSSGPHLFVYGTLKSGFRNRFARRLRREAKFLGPAHMRGRLYRVRWYPGMRPAGDGAVVGELYRLRHPAKTLEALDRYEGDHYRRELRVATRDTGRPMHAWVYIYRFAPPEHRRLSTYPQEADLSASPISRSVSGSRYSAA